MPAAIGRTGVLEYLKADGSTWREYRPPEEAFSPASLASLHAATVTDLHPTRAVTPDTFRAVVRGHVGESARADEDGRHIVAPLYIQDADLIRGIEAGERHEVSAGYNVDLDMTPGTTPDGDHYDAVQRHIRYNHVAIGPRGWGRAGPTVALRLDGAMNSTTDPADAGDPIKERHSMKTERIDGVDFEVGSEAWAQARAKHDAARDKALEDAKAEAAAEKARADAAEKERDAAKGRADSLEADAKKAADPAVIGELVKARVSLESGARLVARDINVDGLSDREVMIAALKADGFEATDAHSDDYVRARFEAAVERAERADSSHRTARVVAANSDGGERLDEMELAQLRHIDRNRNGWRREI